MVTAKKDKKINYQCTRCWKHYTNPKRDGKFLTCPYCGSLEAEEVKDGFKIEKNM